MTERKITIPGEIIAEGDDYLPGEWTEKSEGKIYSLRYGLIEESNKLIKVIPLSGVYSPRRGNVVIGKVEMITFNGWVIDIGAPENGFLWRFCRR
jgi:exosome complex component RRP4